MKFTIDHMILDYKQLNKYFDMYDGKETLVSALAFENTERDAILSYLKKFGTYYEENLCEGAYISILNAPNNQKLGYSLFAIVDYEITEKIIKFKFKENHKIICEGLLSKKEIDIPLAGKCLWGDILKIDEMQQNKGYGGIINKCLFEFAKQKGITIFMANTLFDGEYGRFGKTKHFYENKLKFKVIGVVPEFNCSNKELFKIIYRKLDDL